MAGCLLLLCLRGWNFYSDRRAAGCIPSDQGASRGHYLAIIESCDWALRRISLIPRTPDRINRGIALMYADQQGRAIDDFNEVLRLDPDNIGALLARGLSYGMGFELKKAQQDFDHAVRARPDLVRPWTARGYNFLVQRQVDKAIADYQMALKLAPNDPQVYHFMGQALVEKNDMAGALANVERIIALRPKDGEGYLIKGQILRRMGRNTEAAQAMDRAVFLATDKSTAWYERSTVHFRLEHYDLAVADISKAIAQAPTPRLRYMRCWYRAAWGQQLREALADCDAAIATDAANAAAFDTRAMVRYRLGDYRGAAEDADAALQRDETLETALYVRGLARLKLGDKAGGDADIAKAIDKSPGVARDFAGMGVAP